MCLFVYESGRLLSTMVLHKNARSTLHKRMLSLQKNAAFCVAKQQRQPIPFLSKQDTVTFEVPCSVSYCEFIWNGYVNINLFRFRV